MKVEGKNSVRELLKTDSDIDKILVENGLKDIESRNLLNEIRNNKVRVQFVDKSVMDKESESRKHQGFIAYVADYKYSTIEEIVKTSNEESIVVMLDEILDPHNLGSIIRVCECAGVDGLIIPERRSALVNDTVMRISEGGANHIKIARVTNLNNSISYLKDNGYWVTGAELGGDNLYDADLSGKTVIIVGGEDSGIKRLTKENCDRIVTIPMQGKVNSLNASVACGIVVFEAIRQRRKKNG